MRSVHPLAGLAVGLVFLAACADSTSSGDTLDSQESADIAEELLNASFDALGGTTTAGSPFSSAPLQAVPVSYPISSSATCDGGGTISVSGSLSGDIDTDGSGTLSLSITETVTDCRITTNSKEFVVNSDPTLQMTGDFTFVNAEPSGTQSLSFGGSFTWTSGDGRSGGCGISLTVTFDPATATGSMSGEVCGQSVSRSV
jgi:hypothetical protein